MIARAELPIDDTFAEVEKLVYHTVHAFRRRYGLHLDFEDLKREAFLAFVIAFESHDPERGSFTTCVRWTVWKNLQEWLRTTSKKQSRVASDVDLERFEARQEFDKLGFLDELSHDARIVASLVLDMPRGLARAVSCKPDSPRHARTSIKDYLRGMGWDAARIRESFSEVGRALVG